MPIEWMWGADAVWLDSPEGRAAQQRALSEVRVIARRAARQDQGDFELAAPGLPA